MSEIGIGIKVGYTDVTIATTKLDGLRRSLDEVRAASDVSLNVDGDIGATTDSIQRLCKHLNLLSQAVSLTSNAQGQAGIKYRNDKPAPAEQTATDRTKLVKPDKPAPAETEAPDRTKLVKPDKPAPAETEAPDRTKLVKPDKPAPAETEAPDRTKLVKPDKPAPAEQTATDRTKLVKPDKPAPAETAVKVDYSSVTEATEQLDRLKKASDVTMGDDGNAMEGATKGARQFKKELEGGQEATGKIVKDYDKLIKTATGHISKSGVAGFAGGGIGGSGSDYTEALKRSAAAATKPPRKTAREQYFDLHGNYGKTVKEDTVNDGGHEMAGIMFNKIGMAVAGAVTVGTVMQFLQRARAKYIEGAVNESGLAMRGVSGTGSYLGNTRTEMQQHAADLARQSGYTGGHNVRAVMDFTAATGTDASLGMGVMASSRDLSLRESETGRKMLTILHVIAKGTHDSPERINRLLSGGYGLFSKAQGGAGLKPEQMANIQALTEALHRTGTQGRNPETLGVMKKAFKSTGDSATDILKAEMLGVYDGEMSFDKAWDIKKRESQGLTSSQNRIVFKKLMNDPNLQQSQKYLLASHFVPGMDPEGVESFVNDTIGGLDESNVAIRAGKFQRAKGGIDTSKYSATAGAAVKRRLAEREDMQHAAGIDIENAADPWERRAYTSINDTFATGVPKAISNAAVTIDKNITSYRNEPKVMPESVSTPLITTLVNILSGDSMPIIGAINRLTDALLHPATIIDRTPPPAIPPRIDGGRPAH
jgi:hypothetical protein